MANHKQKCKKAFGIPETNAAGGTSVCEETNVARFVDFRGLWK